MGACREWTVLWTRRSWLQWSLSLWSLGHHPSSLLYLRLADELQDLRIPDDPNLEEVYEARELLWSDLLGDFCFADNGSRVNALAMLLTPFVRDFIPEPAYTPLFVIRAHGPGWGKGWLTEALPYCQGAGLRCRKQRAARMMRS